MRYYFSFTNTMHHHFIDKISLDDLKAPTAHFVFSRNRNELLNGHIPAKVTVYNKEKPRLLPNLFPVVAEDQLDDSIRDKWRAFYQLMLSKDSDGAIIWQRSGESYMRKIAEYLKAGNEVIFDGELQRLELYKWLEEEPVKKRKKSSSAAPPMAEEEEEEMHGRDINHLLADLNDPPVPARRRAGQAGQPPRPPQVFGEAPPGLAYPRAGVINIEGR